MAPQQDIAVFALDTLPGRISYLMDVKNLDVKEVAQICDVADKSVYRWINGESTPYDKFLRRLSRSTGVSYEWIKTGKGPIWAPKQSDTPPIEQKEVDDEPEDLVVVPVAPEGHGAGPGRINDGAGALVQLPASFLRRLTGGRLPERLTFSFVRGDSMMPYLADGTPILIEEVHEIIDGGRYAIHYDDSEEDEIKRLERLGGGYLRISSDNKAFPSRILRHLEDDLYEDTTYGHRLRLHIRGRVVWPPDVAPAVIGELRDFVSNILKKPS